MVHPFFMSEMSDIKTVRTGFIGSGWARITQAPAFAILDGAELTALASPTLRRRKKFQELFDIPHAFADWHDMMELDLDLICVSAPPYLHLPMVSEALARGRNVLCEKPMSVTVEEAEQMTAIARESGRLALLDHELRFHPAVRQIKLMIESGEIGRIHEVRTVVSLASRNRPDLRYSWWSLAEKGGGALGAIGSHLIDLNRFLVGEISEVSCRLSTFMTSRPDDEDRLQQVTSDDAFSMMLQFGPSSLAFGAPACVHVTTVGSYTSFAFEVIGSLKTVRFDGAGRVWEVHNTSAKGGRSLIDPPAWKEVEPVLPWDELVLQEKIRQSSLWVHGIFAVGFAFYADRIVRAVRRNEQRIPDAASFEDGLVVQKVMQAARQSDAERRWIKIKY